MIYDLYTICIGCFKHDGRSLQYKIQIKAL